MSKSKVTSHQQATAFIEHLKAGESTTVPLRGEQPFNRIAQQTINAAAYALWGAGMFSMKTLRDPSRVVITRLIEKRTNGERRRLVSARPYALAVPDDWGLFRRRYLEFLGEDP